MSATLQQYRILFDEMTVGAFFHEADGSLTEVNRAALEMLGLTRDQFTGRTVYHPEWRVVTEEHADLPPEQFPSMIALRTGATVSDAVAGVYNPLRKEFVWLNITATPLFRDGEETPYKVFATINDITDLKKAQQDLAASEERYRAIVNTQTEFVDRHLPGGIMTFVNESLCRYVGVPAEELLGKSFYPYIHEEDRDQTIKEIESLSPENPAVETINRVILTDGTIRWHDWTHHAIFDDNGMIIEYQSVGRDFTDHKLTKDALAKSEQVFHNFFDLPLVGTAMTSPSKEWLLVNDRLCSILGYTKNELMELSWAELTHPDDLAADVEQYDRVLAGEIDGYAMEKRFIRKDGNTIWTSMAAQCVRKPDGDVDYFAALVEDITEQKMAELALRESEERYRRFIATANEGIGISDGDYIITYVNNRLAEMLGYETDELIGMPAYQLLPADEQAVFAAKMAERRQGLSSQHECRHQRKDGSHVWLLTSSTPIFDNDGSFQGCFAMFTDLTGRKEAEIALQQAHDELETRIAERTSALAKANEQIKMMTFQLVRAEEQERTRIAAELHDQVGQSLLLAKMKLDMLTSDSTNDHERTSATDISTLLESCIHDIRTLIFGMRPPLLDTAGLETALEWLCTSIRNDYHLQVDFSCNCRQIYIDGEKRYSLYQAVRELLLNVVKHAGVGRAALSLQAEGNRLVVRVADDGSGFNQSPDPLEQAAGSGLGLFNVQQRIEQMGGSYSIASVTGCGTAVTLAVPLEPAERGE